MRRLLSKSLAAGLLLLLLSCGGPKITQTMRTEYVGPPVNTIALPPGGGPLADAIGIELFNHGFDIVDPERTNQIIGRAGLSEFQLLTPESYGALRSKGIDALLIVKAVMAADGVPESASVRIISTHSGQIIVGLTWQNAWGGRRGSIADRIMRKNLAEAAAQIAAELARRLRR